MRKQRGLYLSSTVFSVLLHLMFFFMVAVSLKTCAGPVSLVTQSSPPPMESIEAEVITQQEVNTYYEQKQQKALAEERALQLEKEQQERALRLAEERKKAELLKQKKLQEEKEKQEQARLEQLRIEGQEQQRQAELRRKEEAERERIEQEQQRQAELRRKEEAERERIEKERIAEEKRKQLEEEQKRIAEEKKRVEEEKKRQLEEEQRRMAEEQKRIEEEKKRQLEEEQRRLAEHRKKEEAERLKMRKNQIAIWQRQYEQMIRSSVEQNWKKPPTSVEGGKCVLKIRQSETGAILNVNFLRCEGDKLFIRSVEAAVWKADPLPKAPSPEVFDSEIELTFKRDY